MTHSFYLILLATLFSNSTIGQPSKSYRIKGMVDSLKDGTKIYLFKMIDRDGKIDSSFIKNGVFLFEGKVNEPTEAGIVLESLRNVEDKRKRKIFWIENAQIKIKGNGRNLDETIVSGPASNKDYERYENEVTKKSSGKYDSLTTSLVITYINKYPASYKSIMSLYLYRQMISFEKTKELFSKTSTQLKTSYFGKEISKFISSNRQLKIGDYAPDFNLPDMNDKKITLSSFKGKYVLLEFWGSWCAPCRGENPLLNTVYEKYKHKNLEVIGIGLDTKKALTEAITADNVKWTNVYTGKYYESPIAYTYGVWAVPDNFLLDKGGRIIGINLEFLHINGEIYLSDRINRNIKKFNEVLSE